MPRKSLTTTAPLATPAVVVGSQMSCDGPIEDACPKCGAPMSTHERVTPTLAFCRRLTTAEDVRSFTHLGCWPHVYDRAEDGEERHYCRWATRGRDERRRRRWNTYPSPAEFPGSDRCVRLGEVAAIESQGLVLRVELRERPVKPVAPLPLSALRAAYYAAGISRPLRRTDSGARYHSAYDLRAWQEACAAQSRPLSPLQLATLIAEYNRTDLDSVTIRRLRYTLSDERQAAYTAERERRRPYREAAFDIRHAAKLPSPAYGSRAQSGGPAVQRALRARGLMVRQGLTPAGVDLVEHALPVLAICGFLGRCGETWTRVRPRPEVQS